ncbi:MAG: acetylglutamate kinase [Anaerolineae bacterium]|nr:acetylglutamate kinase [Anaerolineae bacterium]
MLPLVLKIGGHDLRDEAFLCELSAVVRDLPVPLVLVHGGGVEIADLQQRLGIEPQYLQGLRVTDADSLALVEMVLCGLVNKRLVRFLVHAGVDALGLSGVDRGLLRARQMPHDQVDMGFTGEVNAVDANVIHEMLAQGVTPVVSPLCLGPDCAFNVNADHVAGALAVAIEASRIVFLTNVPGVLREGTLLQELDSGQARELIGQGIIHGGMIPKVETALQALATGVPQALVTNLDGLRQGTGTLFQKEVKSIARVKTESGDRV